MRRDIAKLLATMKPEDLLDVSTRFDRFTKPVRLAWGTDDPFFPSAFGERLAAAFPNATFTPVQDASTFVPSTSPNRLPTSSPDERATATGAVYEVGWSGGKTMNDAVPCATSRSIGSRSSTSASAVRRVRLTTVPTARTSASSAMNRPQVAHREMNRGESRYRPTGWTARRCSLHCR